MPFEESTDGASTVPKQGRRAGISTEGIGDSENENPEIFLKARRKGGWADEGSKSAKTIESPAILNVERLKSADSHNSDDEIPIIPDIDDLPNDSTNLPDVKIPNVAVKRATYKEIDKQNKLESWKIGDTSFGNVGDIDLTLLTSKLYPESEVVSRDETWTINSLLVDLAKNSEKL